MKKNKWLLVLITALTGLLFVSFHSNINAHADDEWQDGVPYFLENYNYANDNGGEAIYDEDTDSLTVDSGNDVITGNDLSYIRASRHVYYIAADNDGDDDGNYDDDDYVTYFKIKTIGHDKIKVYFSQDQDGDDYQYWGTYSIE